MEYLVRLIQIHETFRQTELVALANLANINMEILIYSKYSPYCVVRLANEAAAQALIRRSIIGKNIYELWGSGKTYEALHDVVRQRTQSRWSDFQSCSFKFDLDTYQGKRSQLSQRKIIESFDYLAFNGPIKMKDPEQTFCVFEDYDWGTTTPKEVHLGRWIAGSDRDAINTFSLKTRHYISTTSMDSELALITANLTLAAPGKLFYDPFVGTGSFLIASSHFGAVTAGSDIDGRSVRGAKGRNIVSNFRQYGLLRRYLDSFISDLTHSPLRTDVLFDGIMCDPPYGVREGLRVLGSRDGTGKEAVLIDGKAAHLRDEYIPPKRPYGFEAMLDDILEFAANMLVVGGRLSMWMPTANDEETELGIPTHPSLEIISICIQAFNKWSRRLLTYQKLSDSDIRPGNFSRRKEPLHGVKADDLNDFRKRYFQGFKAKENDD
ncbi:hypothetical protein MMC09_001371 [Bachmanniomyces sp. S44760]|nr:hypothetical protein [Bachmanniomyces sp. S44760]